MEELDVEKLFSDPSNNYWTQAWEIVCCAKNATDMPSEEACRRWTDTFFRGGFMDNVPKWVVGAESRRIEQLIEDQEPPFRDFIQLMFLNDWWRPTPNQVQWLCFITPNLPRNMRRQNQVFYFMTRFSKTEQKQCGKRRYKIFCKHRENVIKELDILSHKGQFPAALLSVIVDYIVINFQLKKVLKKKIQLCSASRSSLPFVQCC